MNKRERVEAAFKGLETDHVPVCMWQHVPQEFWGNDDRFSEEQARFRRPFPWPFLTMRRGSCSTERWRERSTAW